ncbi:MAG: hypothetical protein ABUJ92_13915 [Desulfobacterales bacterium]
MQTYIFSFGDQFDVNLFENLETFTDAHPDFYEVCLDNENEFLSLIKIMGLNLPASVYLNNEDFVSVIDLSNQSLPEFTKDEFDSFYLQWLKETGRDNNMDEYGQLIFLQGVSVTMNKAKSRFVLIVSNN